MKKNGIRVKVGQQWTIGKGTQKLVRESNNLDYDIGFSVHVNSIFVGDSLINVTDMTTGIIFDLAIKNLGKLISEPVNN